MPQCTKILIVDPVGLVAKKDGTPAYQEVKAHIEQKGGLFHLGGLPQELPLSPDTLHFFYQPQLSTAEAILKLTSDGQYDGVIAAATGIPPLSSFRLGGVRIGAGTGNMASQSWGGSSGIGGQAPLMNTPGFNSRATAQMVFKALFAYLPEIDMQALDRRVKSADFDTGRDLADFGTCALAGRKIAILGFGNIGREVARIAKALAMEVTVFAKARHQPWIVAQGYGFAETAAKAAETADVLSIHLGLGPDNANVNLVDRNVLQGLNPGAILVNFDRGELVDIGSLDWALSKGIVAHALIDADCFVDENCGELSGPMAPYIELAKRHDDRLLLLPHVAADTEHFSRVAGAKQAVDQFFAAVRYKQVTNKVGDLPAGYVDCGAQTVRGIGKTTAGDIAAVEPALRAELAGLSAAVSHFWQSGNIDGAQATLAANRLVSLMQQHGLLGPYE